MIYKIGRAKKYMGKKWLSKICICDSFLKCDVFEILASMLIHANLFNKKSEIFC